MAEAIVNHVLGKLADADVMEAVSLNGVCDKVKRVQRDLTWIQSFLKDADTRRQIDLRVQNWVNEVQEVGYCIDDILDKLLAEVGESRPGCLHNILKRRGKMPRKLIAKNNVGNEIDKIQERICEISENITEYGLLDLKETSSGASDEMEVIGFEDDKKIIVDQLIDTNITRRSVISIVGASGSGKTTLAKMVYKIAEVKRHFDISMWLNISKDYKLIDILMKMLKEIGSERQNEGEEYLITELNKCMKDRKYLVVLDDVWSSNVWTQLEVALRNANNGSRVLITTRFINIAMEADVNTMPHLMRPLNEEESKELLVKKIFPNQFANECPSDILPLTTQFTKKCGGWPPSLLFLGRILSKTNPDYITWDRVMQNIDWQNLGMGVISTIYEDLPDALKPCFMYFGVFSKDYQIKATTLIQLWIAEGFIQPNEKEILEGIAEGYLEELVQRGKVQVSRRSCTGKIKYCHIRNNVREEAIQRAKESNFLTVVSENDTKLSSRTCARHVALHVYDDEMIEHAPTNLRSLISFAHVPNLSKFGTLRVLHISTEPCEYLSGTDNLTALKYFGFECSLYSYCQLPTGRYLKRSPLTYMKNLQTVRTRFCKIHDQLPPSFWGNKQLRHINLSFCFLCEGAPEGPPSAADLQRLLTLKGVSARQDWVAELPNFPYIRKLGIFIPENVADEPLMNLLSNLNYLGSLHLETTILKRMTFPGCISAFRNHNRLHSFYLEKGIWPKKEVGDYTLFPPHLVKLTLVTIDFKEDPMPQLEKLPNLRVLKLQCGGNIEAADGEVQMICSRRGFGRLQQLVLSVKHLKEWKIEEGAMPMLNQLVLKRCRKLQIFPALQYLLNLQEFTADGCSDQFNTRLQGEDQWKIKHIPSITMLKGPYI